MPRRRLFKIGASLWIALGIGHFVLVDLLAFAARTSVAKLTHDVLPTIEQTTISFGPLGDANLYRAFAGFSVWVALSLVFLGIVFRMLAAQRAIELRPFVALSIVISATFLALSIGCFIVPPIIASAVATALFVGSWFQREA